MKFQLTSHAIDRWRERIEPGTSYRRTVGPSGDAWEARMVSPNTDATIVVRGEDKERALLALRKAINAGR